MGFVGKQGGGEPVGGEWGWGDGVDSGGTGRRRGVGGGMGLGIVDGRVWLPVEEEGEAERGWG